MNPASTPLLPVPLPQTGSPLRRMRIQLGTWVAIEASAPSQAVAGAAIDAAFAAVDQVAALLSPERAGSDLQRVNGADCGVTVGIHEHTYRLLCFAQRLNRLSDGIFDPCLPHRPGTVRDLELHANPLPAAVCGAPLQLDCGGFAKGFAVDQAVAALRGAGCEWGLVNAGGDVRVFGRAQTVFVRAAGGSARALELADGAVAVSDLDAPRAPSGHRGYYRRGNAAPGARRFAAVRARDAMTADALTKCVLLCPGATVQALLKEFGGECLA